MNDTVPPPHDAATIQTEPSAATTPQKSRSERKIVWFFLFAILAAGSLAFFTLAPQMGRTINAPGPAAKEALQAEIDGLTRRVQALESRTEASNTTSAPTAVPATAPEAAKAEVPPAALTQVQSDLASLSSALTSLQSEVKTASATANEAHDTSQTMVASVVAYIQLREAAAAGHGFANELAQLRDTAKNDSDLQVATNKLEPYAATGAPPLDTLRQQLMEREPAIAVVIAKDAAQTWWQRVLAGLKSLVAVRPIHGDENGALALLEMSLTKDGTAAALEAFNALPANAQQNLADWRKQLEARQHIDEGVAMITAHFTTLPTVKTP